MPQSSRAPEARSISGRAREFEPSPAPHQPLATREIPNRQRCGWIASRSEKHWRLIRGRVRGPGSELVLACDLRCASLAAAPASTSGRLGFAADAEPADVSISETADQVIVDHADRLHVPVDHRRSDEAEPAALEIAAESVRLGGRCRNFAERGPPILPWPSIDKLPAICIEASEFLLHGQKGLSVPHGGRDLRPVPDDRRIGGQLLDSRLGVARDFLRIELAEGAAVALALVEHDRPTEPRLRGLENEEFEVSAVIVG